MYCPYEAIVEVGDIDGTKAIDGDADRAGKCREGADAVGVTKGSPAFASQRRGEACCDNNCTYDMIALICDVKVSSGERDATRKGKESGAADAVNVPKSSPASTPAAN